MQVIQATAMPARKFAENATIRQELAQMDILQNIAASESADIQEAGIILLTDIREMLYAENVPLKPVLVGLGHLVVLQIVVVTVRIIGGNRPAIVEICLALHVNSNNVLADMVNMRSMG